MKQELRIKKHTQKNPSSLKRSLINAFFSSSFFPLSSHFYYSFGNWSSWKKKENFTIVKTELSSLVHIYIYRAISVKCYVMNITNLKSIALGKKVCRLVRSLGIHIDTLYWCDVMWCIHDCRCFIRLGNCRS